jgi:type II secretion system protein H
MISKRDVQGLNDAESHMRTLRGSRGFSIIEVMVGLIIMGIVLAVAVPNFLDHQRTNRTYTAASDLASHVRLARQKALARRATYRLVLNPGNDTYLFQRREGVGNWVNDPDEIFSMPREVDLYSELAGDPSNLDLELDPQGTVDIGDVPAFIRFYGVRDTLTVSVIRTGKVRVNRGT